MNKENPKKNKKSFEYYIAQRKEEFRCQYDHERSWENLQYKLQKRKNHRLSLYCVAASAAFLFLILGVSHIFSLHNNTQNKEAVVAAVVSLTEYSVLPDRKTPPLGIRETPTSCVSLLYSVYEFTKLRA